MGWANDISDIPFKDDEVLDIQFTTGISMATIIFKSGKRLIITINDNGKYSRKDYMNDVSKNNRDITIKNLLKE